jgi:hypothetical protein
MIKIVNYSLHLICQWQKAVFYFSSKIVKYKYFSLKLLDILFQVYSYGGGLQQSLCLMIL